MFFNPAATRVKLSSSNENGFSTICINFFELGTACRIAATLILKTTRPTGGRGDVEVKFHTFAANFKDKI
jgi:hypothetical protein